MIGASKILTVSYGTFSCTLEGFDEPFNTMKAIAEYFRDLAAEDRYFGAEPPTPDAAMLHKIAEREIQRRVEAKIQDNGVILRAGETETQTAAVEPARIAPTVSETPTIDANGDSAAARLSRLRASQTPVSVLVEPVNSQPPAAAPMPVATSLANETYDDEYSEDQHADDMNAAVLESIAARAAAPLSEAAIEDLSILEDTGLEALAQAKEVDTLGAEEAAGSALITEQPEQEEYGDFPGALADLAAEDAPVEDKQTPLETTAQDETPHEIAASAEMLLAETAEEDTAEQTLEDEVGYFDPKNADQLIEDNDQDFDVDDSDATALMLASIASYTAEPVAESAAEPVAEPEAETFAEEAAQLLQHSEASDPDADVALAQPEAQVPAKPTQTPTLSAEEALAEALGIDAPQARAMIANDDSSVAATEEDTAAPPHRARARVIKVRRIQPAASSEAAPLSTSSTGLLSAGAEAAQHAEPTVEVAAQAAPQTVRPTRPVRPVRPVLSPAVAAETAETAVSDLIKASKTETEAEPASTAAESRHLLAEIAEDEAVNRLMAQTNSAMDGPEARRRSMAISHLKAAVAATEADRQVQAANPAKSQPDRQDIYRSDLNSVVRVKPSDAGRSGTDRPSPLMLVSEQRIDRIKPADTAASPRVITPNRPTRVTSAAVSAQDTLIGGDFDDEDHELSAEEASANLFAAGQSFADFAEQLGAESLHDLLEAAAVYCAQVLGRPQFSRPMVMSQLSSLPQGEHHKLEEQLRAFGTLMREGRITKVKRGSFAVTDRSPLLAEALRNVG